MPSGVLVPYRPELGTAARVWPFEEARKILARVEKKEKAGEKVEEVRFETGYGPSGLPHIGTFGEVARTTWVVNAFKSMSKIKTRLITMSDDMDGLRRVPDNVPNKEMMAANLGKPLTSIPDPFGTHESFGHNMNARLRAFLDHYGFEYDFRSATEMYKSGVYDAALLRVLSKYDEVMKVMLPTLGDERQQTYSPFLPVSPRSGKVLLAKVVRHDVAKGTITYIEEDGSEETVPITGGACKLQWKPDFGMRWAALGIDYEMYGKEHYPSAPLYNAICKISGGLPPEQYMFELFLDEHGQKISKSKGNGLTIDEWLTYAPRESLALYMFQKPRVAKRLSFDVIPKAVDDYISLLEAYHANETSEAERLENPVWHIHAGNPPAERYPVSFALLLTLVTASNAHNHDILWGFIRAYAPHASPEANPGLARLVDYAIRYYEDFVKPTKKHRPPTDKERAALADLAMKFEALGDERDAEKVQNVVYEVGKAHQFEPLRDWFKALYEVLFGQSAGPRFGSFAALFGTKETAALIRRALAGEFVKAAA
ncbi:MAG: lysine--tRNA ligase [Alphaproteobacteria bacterium]|nr:lysine--tRNA ligase [Alphaproteobacteria bacterium]MBV9541688.1 lysine--tRNA ligase [Alphaproteobacteria bacterium]